jgi:hypothetical protein
MAGSEPSLDAGMAAAAAEATARDATGNSALEDSGANGPRSHGTAQHGTPPAMPVEISNEIPAQTRADLYNTRWLPFKALGVPAFRPRISLSTGCCKGHGPELRLIIEQWPRARRACAFVTTRILVVDILSGRLPGRWVAGMLVVNAHRVTETSGEGFAVRLLRASNPAGFVRAFSDQPTSFGGFNKVSTGSAGCSLPHACNVNRSSKIRYRRVASGFVGRCDSLVQTEKVMKALYVRKLFLWPRFQMSVKEALEERVTTPADVRLPCIVLHDMSRDDLLRICLMEVVRSACTRPMFPLSCSWWSLPCQ